MPKIRLSKEIRSALIESHLVKMMHTGRECIGFRSDVAPGTCVYVRATTLGGGVASEFGAQLAYVKSAGDIVQMVTAHGVPISVPSEYIRDGYRWPECTVIVDGSDTTKQVGFAGRVNVLVNADGEVDESDSARYSQPQDLEFHPLA